MAEVCATHPARAANGRCIRCRKATCSFCTLDIDGALYCSVLCFTDTTLEAKGKGTGTAPPPAPAADPLSQVDFQIPAEPDASVILSAADAIDPSETSILDLSNVRPEAEPDESAIRPIDSELKDPTSLLGMSWLHEPPTSETPLPMVLPATRRLTIQTSCVFHRDTPAAARCSKCGDAICTLCIGEEQRGGFCAPRCRREIRRARIRALGILGTIAGLVLAVWGLHKPGVARPAPASSVVAVADTAKTELPPTPVPVSKTEREPALLPAPPPVSKPEPKPEPKVEAPKPPPPPPPLKPEPKPEPTPTVEAPKPPEPAPKVELPKPPPPPPPKPEVKAELPKPPPPAPPPPKAAEPAPLERAIVRARDWIRAATPDFCELAEHAGAEPTPEELPALLKRIEIVERKLGLARGEYAAILSEAPNRPLLERRLAILDELLRALRDYRSRLAEGR